MLIGTSEERRQIMQEINQAFAESEATDKTKTKQIKKNAGTPLEEVAIVKETAIVEEAAAIILQNKRKSGVREEPDLREENLVISIRHPHLGTQRRIFRVESTFNEVYDWVGSLSPEPKFFSLCCRNTTDHAIEPSEPIKGYEKIVLVIEERDIPLLNEPEGEIAFTGYGVKDDNDDMYAYADRDNIPEFSANVIESEMENTNCNSGETYLRNNNSPNRDLADITIVAHRRPSSFWRLLFKQNLDASLAFKVIWAGETASDDGGPFREFLVRTMDFG